TNESGYGRADDLNDTTLKKYNSSDMNGAEFILMRDEINKPSKYLYRSSGRDYNSLISTSRYFENHSNINKNRNFEDNNFKFFNSTENVSNKLNRKESESSNSSSIFSQTVSNSRASPATVKWLLDNFESAEGVSLPRATLYALYLQHCSECAIESMNSASFGKMIRSIFSGLRTRRLGTRGNSKYHYYGIKLKQYSNLQKKLREISSKIKLNSGTSDNSYDSIKNYLVDEDIISKR
ncbi:MAG: Transcription factor rfx3, partial [Paramarteilia canceri]